MKPFELLLRFLCVVIFLNVFIFIGLLSPENSIQAGNSILLQNYPLHPAPPESPDSSKALQLAWSYLTGGEISSSPVIKDVNHDGYQEILITSCDGKTYLLDHNGQDLPGWPHPFPYQEDSPSLNVLAHSVPAISDMDQDGEDEIIIHASSYLFVWELDGTDTPGWPRPLENRIRTTGYVGSVTIADLEGDGYKEIITGHAEYLHVFNHDGTPRLGWPKIFDSQAMSTTFSTPCVYDTDGNGALEIIFVADIVDLDSVSKHLTAVWHHDGTLVTGWPQTFNFLFQGNISQHDCSPVVGDIDQDGQVEILAAGYHKVVVYSTGGVQKYPAIQHGRISLMGIGDMNSDGYLEIMIGWPNHVVYLYDYQCNMLPGWPVNCDGFRTYSPICADIDNDLTGEYLLADGFALDEGIGRIQAWNMDGSIVPGYPLTIMGSSTGIMSAPAIGDLNNDGFQEMVFGSKDHKIYMWKLNVPYLPSAVQWPQFHHDAEHTGVYRFHYLPDRPDNPAPLPQSVHVGINTVLHWTCGAPSEQEEFTCNVYFDTVFPPAKVASGIGNTLYNPGILKYNQTYHWRIESVNSQGDISTGPAWQFTTCDSVMRLPMQQGWNLVSLYYMPEPLPLKDIFQPMIDGNDLIIIEDELTGVIWPQFDISGIEEADVTSGYKIKMARDTLFPVPGYPLEYPVTVHLDEGWNIMGYPLPIPRDALQVAEPLIAEGKLVILMDLHQLKLWNDGTGWINEIGDLIPGNAYYVKMVSAADFELRLYPPVIGK